MCVLRLFLRPFAVAVLGLAISGAVQARDVLHVYGPGGPAPAMRQAAQVFAKANGVDVVVTAGPTSQWAGQALRNADLIYSGSEHMMSTLAQTFKGVIDPATAKLLYLREAMILVRPGNPKKIRGMNHLLRSGVRVLTVNGAGQVGLWEDMIGRSGKIELLRALRKNIAFPEAANSGEAKQRWQADPGLDAWLTWGIWQNANPTLADAVRVEPEFRMYRDSSIAITRRARENPRAAAFVAFLRSAEGAAIFVEHGWIAD